MKRYLIISGIVIIGAFSIWSFKFRNVSNPFTAYTFVEITRGNLENSITSTGTLNPVKIVNVGTQVSGKIDRLLVDFNDTVKNGQVLAIYSGTERKKRINILLLMQEYLKIFAGYIKGFIKIRKA